MLLLVNSSKAPLLTTRCSARSFSYWCSAHPAGGGGFQYYVPSGMQLANGTFPTGLEPSAWASKGKGATVRPPLHSPEWTIVYVSTETVVVHLHLETVPTCPPMTWATLSRIDSLSVPEKSDRLLSVQVHAFRRSHWASWMFDVESVAADKILFGKGGYQGCRGGPGEPLMPAELLEA